MITLGEKLSIQKQARLLKVSRGSVYYRPQSVAEADMELMRQIDELHLDYPFVGSRMLRDMNERLITAKANILLQLLSLQSWRHSPISSYYKGMKQRVLIAAALIHDPKLLIFDEPLSGLDVISARLFKDLLQELAAQGKAILYISHVLEVVELVCSRVIVLANGKILADAPHAELVQQMQAENLENVFAQLVQQQDTKSVARELVATILGSHA